MPSVHIGIRQAPLVVDILWATVLIFGIVGYVWVVNNRILINWGLQNGRGNKTFPLSYTQTRYSIVATGYRLAYTYHFNSQRISVSQFRILSVASTGATKDTDEGFYICIGY